MLCIVQIFSSSIASLPKYNAVKVSALIQRHTAVIQKIIVEDPVHTSFFIQEIYMLSQTDTVHKSHLKTFHYIFFLFGQLIDFFHTFSCKTYSWKFFLLDLIFFSANFNNLTFHIHFMKQQFIFHLVIRITQDHLAFQFKKKYRNCFQCRFHRIDLRVYLFCK